VVVSLRVGPMHRPYGRPGVDAERAIKQVNITHVRVCSDRVRFPCATESELIRRVKAAIRSSPDIRNRANALVRTTSQQPQRKFRASLTHGWFGITCTQQH